MSTDRTVVQALLTKLHEILDPAGIIAGADVATAAVMGWSRLGTPLAILRPRSTQEVSEIMRACTQFGIAVVPWGGKTGLVDGALADNACAISLERMNKVEQVDTVNCTMTVQAGCILQSACESAEAKGLLLPLDLGARGSATIGGTISTNAGGNRVVRFGMMRDMVLGVEAVLADGTVVSSLYPFIKNNTGYDLKQLFIGSEGTLGIVTRAVLRLRPRPLSQNVAFIALPDFDSVVRALRDLEARLGGRLSAFEVMWNKFYELVTTAPAKGRTVLPHDSPYYALVESMGASQENDAVEFESVLADLADKGVIADAVIAHSQSECSELWDLRDDAGQVRRLGNYVSFDVSLGLDRIVDFEASLRHLLSKTCPDATLILFGHLGDGNIHVVVAGVASDADTRRSISSMVYSSLHAIDGCISAEHGIGLDKLPYLHLSRAPAELELMRRLKHAFDPHNILNPGKILGPASLAGSGEAS